MTEQRASATDTPLPGFSDRYPSRQEMQDHASELQAFAEAVDFLRDANACRDAQDFMLRRMVVLAEQLNSALDSANAKPGAL